MRPVGFDIYIYVGGRYIYRSAQLHCNEQADHLAGILHILFSKSFTHWLVQLHAANILFAWLHREGVGHEAERFK